MLYIHFLSCYVIGKSSKYSCHSTDKKPAISELLRGTCNVFYIHAYAYEILIGKSEGNRPFGATVGRAVLKCDFNQ